MPRYSTKQPGPLQFSTTLPLFCLSLHSCRQAEARQAGEAPEQDPGGESSGESCSSPVFPNSPHANIPHEVPAETVTSLIRPMSWRVLLNGEDATTIRWSIRDVGTELGERLLVQQRKRSVRQSCLRQSCASRVPVAGPLRRGRRGQGCLLPIRTRGASTCHIEPRPVVRGPLDLIPRNGYLWAQHRRLGLGVAVAACRTSGPLADGGRDKTAISRVSCRCPRVEICGLTCTACRVLHGSRLVYRKSFNAELRRAHQGGTPGRHTRRHTRRHTSCVAVYGQLESSTCSRTNMEG